MENISYISFMEKTYYIYHIKGVKIGVSINPNRRVKNQGYDSFEILETHKDVIKVSEREIELQKQYGYNVDVYPYYKFVDGRASKAGKISGPKNVLIMHQKTSNEQRAIAGKKVMAGPHGQRIRSMGGKVGGPISGKMVMAGEHGERIRSMGGTASSKSDKFMGGYITCKHCSKTMNLGNHSRWHGNNCKNKKGVI